MPPDITAGLMALAGPPPGAAAIGKTAADPTADESLSPTLFASFLAQSGKPALKAASSQVVTQTLDPKLVLDPKLAANPNLVIKAKQPALNNLKTMDILPNLSTSPVVKTKDKASELPLHHASAVENPPPTSAVPAAAHNLSIGPAPTLVPLVLVLPSALLPLQSASESAAPLKVALIQTSPILATPLPIPQASSAASQFESPKLAAPKLDVSVPAGLTLPRTWSLTAPFSAPSPPTGNALTPNSVSVPTVMTAAPNTAGQSLSANMELPPEALAVKAPSVRPIQALVSDALPQVASPVQVTSVESEAALPAPTVTALAGTVPQPTTVFSPALTAVVESGLVPLAGNTSVSEPAKPISGKAAEKPLQIALKPTSENADINTGTPQSETATVSVETPVVAPKLVIAGLTQEPVPSSSEKQNMTKNTLAPDVLASVIPQTADPITTRAGIESKPLSAADHAAMVSQVAGGVAAMPLPPKAGETQQMSLQLHPKDWGSLQVSVSVVTGPEAGSAKTVTAHIIAETPQVKAALQSQTGALHQALRASGLNLAHLTVSVKAPDTKAAEMKPAQTSFAETKPTAQSASAGLSVGQSQSNASGQPGTNSQSNSSAASSQMGTSAGGSQNGRQGQPPPTATAFARLEPEEAPVALLSRAAVGRVDTRA